MENKCEGDHALHMCAMAEDKKFSDIRNAAVNPEFVCSNCGRCASSAENLCSPVPFENIDPGIPLE